MTKPDNPMDSQGAKVLIVEDEESLAALYEAWLSEEHEVITTHTVDDGIAALDASVDVVVLDRRLPNGSGKHVLDHIQNQGLDCMVTMVTAFQPEFEIAQLPIDDYLVKPIERDELLSTVNELSLRSSVTVTRQELLALLSRKIALEEENHPDDLKEASEYQQLQQKIEVLNDKLGISPQDISSRHRPDACTGCGLRWNIDLDGTVGFISLASRVWKCTNCGRVIDKPDPSNRSVTRGR